MISIYRFLIVSVVIGWAINIKAQIKVACVGNSITENIALSNIHPFCKTFWEMDILFVIMVSGHVQC